MNVAELEAALFGAFPREDAERWDHVGCSVGDPEAPVRRVMVALDASEAEVRAAAAQGANILVAHHPVYLDAPDTFAPAASAAVPQASAAVFQAVRSGVAVISMHTNLDRSRAARELLPRLLGMEAIGSLEHPDDPAAPGIGALADHTALTLEELAERAAATFDTVPRVWGDPAAQVRRTAVVGGALGSFGEQALAAGAEAIVCGEAGYHVCQDLAARGCGAIFLGHDASELPFRRILADAVAEAGVPRAHIILEDRRRGWWLPGEGERR